MARFSQIVRGVRARRRVLLPLGDAPAFQPDLDAAGLPVAVPSPGSVSVDLRPLTSGEQADVLARATADAKSRGVMDPRDGNPIYDLAEMEHTLALCCLDPDSPDDAPRPFFDGGVEQIRSSPDLGRDRIVYLFEQHQLYQDECAPSLRKINPTEFIASLGILGGDDDRTAQDFFGSMGPGLRWICLRTLARLARTSPTPNLSPTSASGSSGANGTSPRSEP